MANPRLASYWSELRKLQAAYVNDNFLFGHYIIDTRNKIAEMDGDPFLKNILFEAASSINRRWVTDGEMERSKPVDGEVGDDDKIPPGKKC